MWSASYGTRMEECQVSKRENEGVHEGNHDAKGARACEAALLNRGRGQHAASAGGRHRRQGEAALSAERASGTQPHACDMANTWTKTHRRADKSARAEESTPGM